MKNNNFIGQFEKTITDEEINRVVDIVKKSLDSFNVPVTSIDYENGYSGIFIKFNVAKLDYEYKDKRGTRTTGIKKINCYFVSQYGFTDYDYLRQLEAEGKKTVENATATGYSFYFSTDAKYRKYRCKRWNSLEGKNHFIYNDDLQDKTLEEEIRSYFVNLLAYKGL